MYKVTKLGYLEEEPMKSIYYQETLEDLLLFDDTHYGCSGELFEDGYDHDEYLEKGNEYIDDLARSVSAETVVSEVFDSFPFGMHDRFGYVFADATDELKHFMEKNNIVVPFDDNWIDCVDFVRGVN